MPSIPSPSPILPQSTVYESKSNVKLSRKMSPPSTISFESERKAKSPVKFLKKKEKKVVNDDFAAPEAEREYMSSAILDKDEEAQEEIAFNEDNVAPEEEREYMSSAILDEDEEDLSETPKEEGQVGEDFNLFPEQTYDAPAPTRVPAPALSVPSTINTSVPTRPSLPPLIKDWKTAVVSSQLFDGCWDTAALSKVLESRANIALSQNPHSEVKIWATALAIAILELKCVDSKSTWEIVANKGRTFMSKILFGLEKKDSDEIIQMVSDLIEKAKKVIYDLI
jgi:hypothetical protein